MTRLDPITAAIWLGLGLIVTAFWLWLAVPFWPTVQDALRAAGALSECRSRMLSADECTAYAQGDAQ